MLKTNSKQAIMNIRNYIKDIDNLEAYETDETMKLYNTDSKSRYQKILLYFEQEQFSGNQVRYYNYNRYEAFKNWAAGLPSILNTADYYYCNSAINVLGDILQETEQERNKYTEQQAEDLLTWLIYRELNKMAGYNC